MNVYCPSLLSGKFFPTRCAARATAGGQNSSPHILWGDVPAGTGSFLVSVADALGSATSITYWYVINIAPSAREIPDGASLFRDRLPKGALELRNPSGESGYLGPSLNRLSGQMEVVITVRALSIDRIPVGPFSTPGECEMHLAGAILGEATIAGLFQR
jgi:Raf kinase inhibitor-like YbhB/YbcL family protein